MNTHALQFSGGVTAADLGGKFSIWLAKSQATNSATQDFASICSIEHEILALDTDGDASLLRTGLRASYVWELVALFGLSTKAELLRLLSANDKSLRRWAREDKLMPTAVVEKILRTMQLQLVAADVFGGIGHARVWLSRPHPVLNGMAPGDCADNEFASGKVRALLVALKHGGAI